MPLTQMFSCKSDQLLPRPLGSPSMLSLSDSEKAVRLSAPIFRLSYLAASKRREIMAMKLLLKTVAVPVLGP